MSTDAAGFDEKFSACYDSLCTVINLDYSLTLDVVKSFQAFILEALDSPAELVEAAELPAAANFGASVKIDGDIPFIIGMLAEKSVFHEIADRYEKFETDTIEEDYDAVSELLNVFTGHFTIKLASVLGIEEELEPPRFGQAQENIGVMKFHIGIGNFYLYIGREEIFRG